MDLTKMGMIQLQNPGQPAALLQKANQMRLAGTLCDVVILVDGHEFRAHRTVLACTSKMFEILFHRNSQHYTLDFLSPKTFQQILEYAYTATLQARVEDLDDLLYAAEILEIEYLEEQCLKILETIQASSEDNEGEANAHERDGGGAEEDGGERRARIGRCALLPKKHSAEEEGGGGYGYGDAAQRSLALAGMVEQSPSVSTSFGVAAGSPTKAAVDSLMSMGHSLLQGASRHDARASPRPPSGKIKTEAMQVDEASGRDGTPGGGEKNGEAERGRDDPGTPTRGSVITSARGLHYAREDGGPDPQGDGGPAGEGVTGGLVEKHPPSLFTMTPNHKGNPLLSMPPSMGPPLHMPPGLAMSMDFGSYGALLPQSFIQREFFSKLGEFTAVVKPASRSPDERCGVCGADLPDSDAVEQHRKLHSGMKTYGCELCGKRFLDSLRLRMHLLSHSAGAKPFVCDQCGAQFSKEDALETHRQTHTGSDMAVFCLLCGKRFQTQTALQQHMEVHAGVRSYICSECNRTFPSHTALKRHLRSHTGDHPFECEFCGSCFRDESTLKGHKRIHTGEKPYECNGCGKKFSLKHQLETHYRVHTGEKPFECKLCHQRSRDYSAMIKHLRTHNGASPYQCTICLEYCPSLSAMQKHMKGHKPEDVPADWRIEKTYLYLCYV
ncbi:zinc finger and BTB domain-containing protein 16-A [Anguilla anguilla]|uniref:zinc finger and BTB domain-containing protein 16-A n=1 Tax=Anguilla anguilla TaxID=7936 RepID=UPI0015AB9B98|nr:zinc finger and BTB domain-containing protein 16-A [Anguilla anguilla]XP_035241170.1 zinc finger and BTB domain-containing protein 16-A [Anguilla anguilla]